MLVCVSGEEHGRLVALVPLQQQRGCDVVEVVYGLVVLLNWTVPLFHNKLVLVTVT